MQSVPRQKPGGRLACWHFFLSNSFLVCFFVMLVLLVHWSWRSVVGWSWSLCECGTHCKRGSDDGGDQFFHAKSFEWSIERFYVAP